MTILIVLGIVFVLSLVMALYIDPYNDIYGIVGFIIGCVLAVMLFLVPCIHAQVGGEIVEFKQVRSAMHNAKTRCIDKWWEEFGTKACVERDLVEKNDWLINIQYWNTTCWGVYIPDEVDNLKMLK